MLKIKDVKNNMISNLNKIWDSTDGDDVVKAHAILKEYFQPSNSNFVIASSAVARREQAIQLFMEKKSKNGKPLDTVEKLLSAAASISSGPQFQQYLDVIYTRINQETLHLRMIY